MNQKFSTNFQQFYNTTQYPWKIGGGGDGYNAPTGGRMKSLGGGILEGGGDKISVGGGDTVSGGGELTGGGEEETGGGD